MFGHVWTKIPDYDKDYKQITDFCYFAGTGFYQCEGCGERGRFLGCDHESCVRDIFDFAKFGESFGKFMDVNFNVAPTSKTAKAMMKTLKISKKDLPKAFRRYAVSNARHV